MTPRASAGFAALITVLAFGSLGACRASEPPSRPEETCTQACADRARTKCTDGECAHGCRVALDRYVEREGEHVIACVASAKNRRCDDLLWADCAAQIGAHADGGPPAPKLKKDDDDDDEDEDQP